MLYSFKSGSYLIGVFGSAALFSRPLHVQRACVTDAQVPVAIVRGLTSRLWRKVHEAKRHAKFVAHQPAVRFHAVSS
jgi:hypothetical protein